MSSVQVGANTSSGSETIKALGGEGSQLDKSSQDAIAAQERLQKQSQAFQLAMANLQAKDAMAKSMIAFQEAMAASDRENANRVAQFASK